MILVIDNYDSFVFNLARYFEEAGAPTQVLRNDAVDVAGIIALSPRALVISPGPKGPREAGVSMEAVRELSGTLPILGVCLGHQCIGAVFGGRVARAAHPLHGRATPVTHEGRGLFGGLAQPMAAGRYHSLIVEETEAMAHALTVEARSAEGEVMALRHRRDPTFGIQFHPESVLTPEGPRLVRNFLDLAERWHADPLA